MSLLSLCTKSATIERPSYAADSYGGQVATFATQYTIGNCTIQPLSGRIIEEFAKRSLQVSHIFFTPTEIALLAGDRIIIDSVKYIVVDFGDAAGRGQLYYSHLIRKD